MYCQKCGTQNPEGANNCQNCGAPLNATPAKPKKKKTGLIIGIVAVIAVIAIIGSIGGGGDKKPDTSSSGDTSASTSAAVATTEKKADAKFVVKLGETKVIEDYEGKPTLLVNYSFTNNSDKKQSFMVAIKDSAFQNGIGLNDLVENRLVGMKSRGVYENPAGAILFRAHDVLETITLDRDTQHYKELVAHRFAELVYFGQWYTPLREALSAFVDKTQETVTGDVKLKLYKGNIINAGVTSPYTLYSEDFATFDADDVYNQKDSAGFINLFGLPIKVRAILEAERNK